MASEFSFKIDHAFRVYTSRVQCATVKASAVVIDGPLDIYELCRAPPPLLPKQEHQRFSPQVSAVFAESTACSARLLVFTPPMRPSAMSTSHYSVRTILWSIRVPTSWMALLSVVMSC